MQPMLKTFLQKLTNRARAKRAPRIAFFGTPDRAVMALSVLKENGIVPSLIITQPDRPQGRKMLLTPPPVKTWAIEQNIPYLQPEDLSNVDFLNTLRYGDFDVFVVVAYGKILKKELMNIAKHGSINLHASLLPELRGSCPIETAILQNKHETGTTIILMDEKMDHGPILGMDRVDVAKIADWPLPADRLAEILVTRGSRVLANVIYDLISGTARPIEQNHALATYTKKIVKEDGHINLTDDGYTNFLKYNAYYGWPGTFFFHDTTRVIITHASYRDGVFTIEKVIPEGKREMTLSDFYNSLK